MGERMPLIASFEDVEAWQMARKLSRTVYQVSRGSAFSRDEDLRRQIRRAAVSAMSNIAEGFERGKPPEFLYFLRIAKASVGEIQSQLYVALDENYITPDDFKTVKQVANSTKKLIAGFMHYLSHCPTPKKQPELVKTKKTLAQRNQSTNNQSTSNQSFDTQSTKEPI